MPLLDYCGHVPRLLSESRLLLVNKIHTRLRRRTIYEEIHLAYRGSGQDLSIINFHTYMLTCPTAYRHALIITTMHSKLLHAL